MRNITGRIENWVYDEYRVIIIGDLYDDINTRWDEGQLIRTSRLLPMSLQSSSPKEGGVVNTLNSTYLLGKRK